MAFTEIYASPSLADCEHLAFVLRAVGIEHVIGQRGDVNVVLVLEEDAATARDHLRRYAEESRPRPPPPALRLYANAWTGALLYVAVMTGIAYCAGVAFGGFDWYRSGSLTRAAVHGEPWRAITALTLHADIAHLIANLVFGIPYGFFAAQLLGVGRAWVSILIAATLGNLLDAALMGPYLSSIGASTAVFAMLGLVAAYSWRTTATRLSRWAHRWAPLVAAVALLAITGVGDERTDVTAHLAGFMAGVMTGSVQANLPARIFDRPAIRWTLALATPAIVAGAWLAAATR